MVVDVRREEIRQKAAQASPLATQRQPKPRGTGQEIYPLVWRDLEALAGSMAGGPIADVAARVDYGIAIYGEPLRSNNGRDAVADALQEAVDAPVYIRQLISEGRTDLWPTYGAALYVLVQMSLVARGRPPAHMLSGITVNNLDALEFEAEIDRLRRVLVPFHKKTCAGASETMAPCSCGLLAGRWRPVSNG